MPENEQDIRPVTHITTDAIGQPGERTFYLRAWHGEHSFTLIVEKVHVQLLAAAVEQLMEQLARQYPGLSAASAEYDEAAMRILPPVEPIFKVGEISLGYDAEHDFVVLITRELLEEGEEGKEPRVMRFWCSRPQMLALCAWGLEVSGRGRPICGQCGEPIDPAGHFCPKRNGHRKIRT